MQVDLSVTVGEYVAAADIPSYVAALYRYGLSVGVTLAMVMVVVGGFQYMTARGNPAAIGAARGRITNAILGLLLLLGSFTLLQTINPELVTMRNIIVPEIQRVETISNKCEDLSREEYTVTPTTGRCGESGTVARRDSTQLATNTCTWGACGTNGEVCVVRGAEGPGCVACASIIDDQLEHWGLSQTNDACNRFSPANVGTVRNDCVFAQDSRFDLNDDVCAHATVDCSAVRRCGDYDARLMVRHGSVILRAEELLIDQHGGGTVNAFLNIAEIFPSACQANPCEVSTGCHAQTTAAGHAARLQVGAAGALSAEITGDMWDCMDGPG